MAKKVDFKPDKPRSSLLSKLYLTQKQRQGLLKWVLYAAILLVLSVVQDVLMCKVRLFGATTDLVPCGIFLICLLEGTEAGCVFSLIASCLYLFSGSAAGNFVIVLITVIAFVTCMVRQSSQRNRPKVLIIRSSIFPSAIIGKRNLPAESLRLQLNSCHMLAF